MIMLFGVNYLRLLFSAFNYMIIFNQFLAVSGFLRYCNCIAVGEKLFQLHSVFDPAGDQPNAIRELTNGLLSGYQHQTLLGVTGSGKTFTVANVIQNIQIVLYSI